MKWQEQFPKSSPPEAAQIRAFVANPLWEELCGYLEQAYGIMPLVEHSVCSMAPGWNVKYRKSGRALCTLYPAAGYFTCLVTIGERESREAELLLPGCTAYVRELYKRCSPMNGSRWLMIDVTSEAVLADVKALTAARKKPVQPNS